MARCKEPVRPDALPARLKWVLAGRAVNAELGDHREAVACGAQTWPSPQHPAPRSTKPRDPLAFTGSD